VTAVTLSEAFDATPNCVGKPFEGNDILIIQEDGTEAKSLEKGEICIGGPLLMNGYYDNPKLTKSVIKEHNGKLYYHTSDIGYKDQQGRIYFSHRKDELVKVNGYFVNPLEVEEALYCVEEAMEVKVFINHMGKLCAMMVLNRHFERKILKEKTIQAMQTLDRWSQPTQFYIVNEIPKNEMRKMDLKQINQRLIDRVGIEFLEEWSL
jgi:long-chain acyl-CoA synthetase